MHLDSLPAARKASWSENASQQSPVHIQCYIIYIIES